MESKDKLKAIEQMVEEDCCNGRHIQQKVKQKLSKNGMCPQKFLDNLLEVKKLKIAR